MKNYKVGFNIDESGEIFVSLTNIANGNVVLNEKVTEKLAVVIKQVTADVADELSEARSLLYDAQSLLDDIHGYDTNTYREISRFLDGEEEDE